MSLLPTLCVRENFELLKMRSLFKCFQKLNFTKIVASTLTLKKITSANFHFCAFFIVIEVLSIACTGILLYLKSTYILKFNFYLKSIMRLLLLIPIELQLILCFST